MIPIQIVPHFSALSSVCAQLTEKAYGKILGAYTTASGWCTGCYVVSVATANTRRSVDFGIAYRAYVGTALQATAQSAADAITVASFNIEIAAVNTAGWQIMNHSC